MDLNKHPGPDAGRPPAAADPAAAGPTEAADDAHPAQPAEPAAPADSAGPADPVGSGADGEQGLLRVGDRERDRTAERLATAHSEGRITAEEHAERVESVYAAKTRAELDLLVRDLPREPGDGAPPASPASPAPGHHLAPGRPVPGTVPPVAEENLVAVLSSSVRKGRWRVPRRTHAYAAFGAVEIDLSKAVFEYPSVVIRAVSVFGSVEVRVPENVSLRGSGGGVLGSFEVDHLDAPDPNAPVVYVEGIAVLGSIEAKAKRGRFVTDLRERMSRRSGTDHPGRRPKG